MAATDAQVQQFVDERLRRRAEQARALAALMTDDKAAIDGVYAALNAQAPTWEDNRIDVPQNVTPSDVLAFNTFLDDVKAAILDHPQYPVILKFCVRPIDVGFVTNNS